MVNQNTKQKEVLNKKSHKGKVSKGFKRLCLGLVITGIAYTVIHLVFADPSTSRPSTREEIARQMALREKWKAEYKIMTQSLDSILWGD